MNAPKVREPISRKTSKLFLLLAVGGLLFVHFWFGIEYLFAVPSWESYDEPGHFAYAAQLADKGRLPSELDENVNPERIQPPLYYLGLAAILWLSHSDVSDFTFPTLNPYFHYGTSGHNYAIHNVNALTPGEVQIRLALVTARVASLFFSLFGVVFVYRAARLLWPGQLALPLAAAAIYAMWPQLLFNSSVVSNDGPAAVFGAILTWLLLQFRRGRPSLRLMIACAVTLAAGALVKLNIVILIVPVVLVALITLSPRVIVGTVALGTASIAGVIALLQSLPGVLLPFLRVSSEGDNAVSTIIRRLGEPGTFEFLGSGLRYALDSSFGLFGWGNLALPNAIQIAWMIGVGLVAVGLVVSLITRHRDPHWQSLIVLLGIVGAMVFGALGLVLFYKSIHLIPGRYLLPALPAFCLLIVVGLTALRTRIPMWGVVGGLVLMGILVPVRLIAPAYSQPPTIAEDTIPNAKTFELAPGVLFLGFDVPPVIAYPGDVIPVEIYWKAARPLRANFTVRLELIGPDGQGYGLLDTYPGGGNYATSDWAVNKAFKDSYMLYVRQDFPAPAVGHFKVTLLPDDFKVFAQFGDAPIHSHDAPSPTLEEKAAAQFGERLLLRDLKLSLAERMLKAEMVWQAAGTMNDGTVFVHIELPQGSGPPLAQQDNPPRAGTFPLSHWQPGEIISDSYSVPIPASLAAGRYPVRMGVYDPINPYRWPVQYNGKSDALLIGWLNVNAEGVLSIETAYPTH